MMEKISVIRGVGVPLRRSNVDTDQILPSVYLKRVTKTGYEDALFANWRSEPDFILNRPEYANPRVLIVGPDFGTGSSREHAVWALRDFGFRAVLGSRFGDIFRGNAGKQGLLVGELAELEVEALWVTLEEQPGVEVVVDLVEQKVSVGKAEHKFDIDPYIKWRLIEGLDDIALTLREATAISEFEEKRPVWMPKTLPALGQTEPGTPALT